MNVQKLVYEENIQPSNLIKFRGKGSSTIPFIQGIKKIFGKIMHSLKHLLLMDLQKKIDSLSKKNKIIMSSNTQMGITGPNHPLLPLVLPRPT